jgi:hypothetical protein
MHTADQQREVLSAHARTGEKCAFFTLTARSRRQRLETVPFDRADP